VKISLLWALLSILMLSIGNSGCRNKYPLSLCILIRSSVENYKSSIFLAFVLLLTLCLNCQLLFPRIPFEYFSFVSFFRVSSFLTNQTTR
ncbi:hypothetical protein C8Q69DRAFT_453906, partial [Paecilomyces variotii]